MCATSSSYRHNTLAGNGIHERGLTVVFLFSRVLYMLAGKRHVVHLAEIFGLRDRLWGYQMPIGDGEPLMYGLLSPTYFLLYWRHMTHKRETIELLVGPDHVSSDNEWVGDLDPEHWRARCDEKLPSPKMCS